MTQGESLTPQPLKTPRAAAIAGIVFSLLMATSMLLIRVSIPADPLGAASEVANHLKAISLALNLLPFAGIAFLWFVAVLRDRLGELEDRFFATVFFGSGLLFVATIFASAAIAGGMTTVLASRPEESLQPGAYALGRAEMYELSNNYAMRMAGVFMISTSTISLPTRLVPRWMALLGYALALMVLLSIKTVAWIQLVFPLWVLLISTYVLSESVRERREAAKPSTTTGAAKR